MHDHEWCAVCARCLDADRKVHFGQLQQLPTLPARLVMELLGEAAFIRPHLQLLWTLGDLDRDLGAPSLFVCSNVDTTISTSTSKTHIWETVLEVIISLKATVSV